ncbi:MAG: hypothetical protein WB950_10105, partial [Acidobacteriaceae bacterium]
MRMVSCRTTRRSTVQLALTLVVWIVLMPAASRRSAAAMVDATNAQAQSAHKASSEKSSTQSTGRGLPL